MEYKGLKLYDAEINPEKADHGVAVMSFVKKPAVDSLFMKFNDENTNTPVQVIESKFSLEEDKRIVTGVAMRAEYPMYRDINGEQFYVKYTPKAIEDHIMRFMKEKRLDDVNIYHNGKKVEGVFMFESFILNDNHKLNFEEFKDIENGSWMVSYKVENDEVWEQIKSGELMGFSVESKNELHEISEDNKDYKEIYSLLNKLKFDYMKSKVLDGILMKMAKIMDLKFNSVDTDKGMLYFYDAEEIEVGLQVWVKDENDENQLPEDGEYGYDDKIVVIENGVVQEIKPKAEVTVEGEVEVDEVPEATNSGEYVTKEDFNQAMQVLKDLILEVKGHETAIEELETNYSKSKKTPITEPKKQVNLKASSQKGDSTAEFAKAMFGKE